jgi:hypothetical protein
MQRGVFRRRAASSRFVIKLLNPNDGVSSLVMSPSSNLTPKNWCGFCTKYQAPGFSRCRSTSQTAEARKTPFRSTPRQIGASNFPHRNPAGACGIKTSSRNSAIPRPEKTQVFRRISVKQPRATRMVRYHAPHSRHSATAALRPWNLSPARSSTFSARAALARAPPVVFRRVQPHPQAVNFPDRSPKGSSLGPPITPRLYRDLEK